MLSIIDISVPLQSDMPTWPGSPGFLLEWGKRLDAGDECNNAYLHSDIHVGTHIDAPFHFLSEGKTVEQVTLDALIGPAWVAHLPETGAVTAADLSGLSLQGDVERLLLRTPNSALWARGEKSFQSNFVALTEDAAHWLVDHGVRLLGVDYLSVQRYQDGPAVHKILLAAEVVIVEGLNLAGVTPGEYELICLPIKITGAEGAPARAILRRTEE